MPGFNAEVSFCNKNAQFQNENVSIAETGELRIVPVQSSPIEIPGNIDADKVGINFHPTRCFWAAVVICDATGCHIKDYGKVCIDL